MHNRQHPLFPTHHEVELNSEIYYSDHLPMMYDIPVGESERPVRIISWNILGSSAPSGCHKVQRGWEDDDQARKRYARIAASLVKFAKMYQPDVIALQESFTEYFPDLTVLFPDYELKDTLKGNAMLVKKPVNENSLVLENVEFPRAIHNNLPMQGLQKATFRRDKLKIIINNVHTKFYDTPENHEGFYSYILQGDDAAISIVVGDTNTRVAPKDESTSLNIATGIVPMSLNKEIKVDEDVQMTDFPDAAFYRGNDRLINQANHVVLDYHSGEIFQQQHENGLQPKWHQFRMLMCLTDFNKDSDKIQGKTVFEFQEELAKQFPSPSQIIVRKAAKDNNERGFGFAFKDSEHPLCVGLMPAFNKVAQAEPQLFQTIPYKYYVGRYEYQGNMLFVHKDRINQFLEILNSYKHDHAIAQRNAPVVIQPIEDRNQVNEMKPKQRIINWIRKHPVATGLIIGAILIAAVIIAGAVTWGVGALPASIIGLSLGAKIGITVGIGVGTPLAGGVFGFIGSKAWNKRKETEVLSKAFSPGSYTPVKAAVSSDSSTRGAFFDKANTSSNEVKNSNIESKQLRKSK